MSLKFRGSTDRKTSISAHVKARACFCLAAEFRPISFSASFTSSAAVGSATPDARCTRPIVDTYLRTVAGFLPFPKHSNTNARTVLGVAGNDSNRYARQLSVKAAQSAFQARKVFAAKAPCAIFDQSAKRSAGSKARAVGVVSGEFTGDRSRGRYAYYV